MLKTFALVAITRLGDGGSEGWVIDFNLTEEDCKVALEVMAPEAEAQGWLELRCEEEN